MASAGAAVMFLPGAGTASATGRSAPSAQAIHATLPVNFSVVASGLNQPRKVTIGPDGNLYVTEAGVNTPPAGCVAGTEAACANPSGAIAQVTPTGTVKQVVSALPSINKGSNATSGGSAGPSGITIEGSSATTLKYQALIQDANINSSTGAESYGSGGTLLGDLLSSSYPAGGTASSVTVEAQMGQYEAQHNPDGGTVDSSPSAVVAYEGGLAIADQAGNDVLLYRDGTLSTLTVLPTVAATGGHSQAEPTSLAVGPDGDLYIGEMVGTQGGSNVALASVYKLSNGTLTPVAKGFTTISDIAFDQAGRLLVLEADTHGSLLAGPGALMRVNSDGSQTTLASTGLFMPAGMAVGADGSIYLTNNSIVQGSSDPYLPALSGEVVRVADSSTADEIGANYGGYREVARDGGVFTFGAYGFYGSMGGTPLNKPIVDATQTPLGPGYWMVGSDGGVFTFGTARFFGSTGGMTLNQPVVTIAPTPDGKGYYLFAADGGVFTFGDAAFKGSLGNLKLNQPIVAATVTPDGGGYFLYAADGGVFAFGDAHFYGSMGSTPLNQPVVSGMATPDGKGYYMFAGDGGVFSFGDAHFYGSMGSTKLNQPVVNGESTPNNLGYREVASDGGVFDFGNAVYYGSMGGIPLNQPVVSFG